MILEPLNDFECLSAVSERAAAATWQPEIQALAQRFLILGGGSKRAALRELVRYIRRLPQRNDGAGDAGPRVAQCVPAARLRIRTDDPNCVERSALYLAVAELIDPRRTRRLITIETEEGLHTYPVEDDRPVLLAPERYRNAAASQVHQVRAERGERGAILAPLDAMAWSVDLLRDRARKDPDLSKLVTRALSDVTRLAQGGQPRWPTELGQALRLAVSEADKYFGVDGRKAVASALGLAEKIARGRRLRAKDLRGVIRGVVTAAAIGLGVPLPVATLAGGLAERPFS